MDRRLAFAVGVSIIWPSLAGGVAQAQCREETVACESACIGLEDQPAKDCTTACRSIIVCDNDRDQTPSSRLPESALPESRLPKSRLPGGSLPDSTFN